MTPTSSFTCQSVDRLIGSHCSVTLVARRSSTLQCIPYRLDASLVQCILGFAADGRNLLCLSIWMLWIGDLVVFIPDGLGNGDGGELKKIDNDIMGLRLG